MCHDSVLETKAATKPHQPLDTNRRAAPLLGIPRSGWEAVGKFFRPRRYGAIACDRHPGSKRKGPVMNRALLITLCAVAIQCIIGCTTPPTAAPLTYEYVAQVRAMPSCTATVQEIAPCYARLKTEDGRVLYIGSPGAAPEVVGFVQTLQKGKTYFLPDAFMKYQRDQREKMNKPDAGDGK